MDDAEFGCAGCGDDDTGGRAVGDECAHEDGIVAVGDGDGVAWGWRWDYVDGFCDRVVFSCQGGFVDFEVHALILSERH